MYSYNRVNTNAGELRPEGTLQTLFFSTSISGPLKSEGNVCEKYALDEEWSS